MEFFAAMADFIYLISSDEACDFERVFSGFLEQLAKGSCQWLFTGFHCSCGNLDPCGGGMWMLEYKELIVVIDNKNGYLWY